jgi:uridylate kinase
MISPYETVVLKLSGEALGGEDSGHLDSSTYASTAVQISEIVDGIRCTVVMGGGNIFRGRDSTTFGLSSSEGDVAGMLATGVNAILLSGMLAKNGVPSEIFTRGPCSGFGSRWAVDSIRMALSKGTVAIVAGGLRVPGLASDVPAVDVAAQLGAQLVVMSKHDVRGVFFSRSSH